MAYKYKYEASNGGYPIEQDEYEEDVTKCELCNEGATEKVDIDPIENPNHYIADLCSKCTKFERIRINNEIKNMKL